MIQIKNKVIGEGKPLICVSVMDAKKADILAEMKRLVAENVEMMEWRVDAFEGVKSLNAVREVLQEAAELLNDTIFVFTFRSNSC